jgi:ParB-like chromosome segregation protein Spo0J
VVLALCQNLELQSISIDKLLLDPNNPRFLDFEEDIGIVQDERISEPGVQSRALEKLSRFDIRQLKDSIAEVGFLPMDRMVVRPIGNGNYVIVEGNRRLAAIKSLLEDHEAGRELPQELFDQLQEIEVWVLQTDAGLAARDQLLLAGLRHISGVKSWGPYQRAIALRSLTEQMNGDITAAGKALGIGRTAARRLLQALKALEDLREDEEYGDFAKPSMFSYFEEVMKSPALRDRFLGWDRDTWEFMDVENLHLFYSWVFPEGGQDPKIARGAEVRDLAKVVTDLDALEEFKKPGVSLAQALSMTEEMRQQGWERPLRKAVEALDAIPISALENFSQEQKELLGQLISLAQRRLQIASSLQEASD